MRTAIPKPYEDIGDMDYDAMYCFTDIYGHKYYTPVIQK